MESEYLPSLEAVCPAVKVALRDTEAMVFDNAISNSFDADSVSKSISTASDGIIYMDGVLKGYECQQLCYILDQCKNLTFWNAEGRENEKARLFRNADTVEVVDINLAGKIWNRVKDLYDVKPLNVSEDDPSLFERELPGEWYPVGLNQNFLFAKYPPGGHFAPHTDGREIHSFNRRSFYSVIIYLNNIPPASGGGTRFYRDDALSHLHQDPHSGRWTCSEQDMQDFILDEVHAVEGRMCIFDQRLVHEGICCAPPPRDACCKYIIRSDVMYERRPAVCDSPSDIEAYSLFKQAEALAEAGNVEKSIPLFRKACKMSPALAEMMGQG